MYVYISGDYIAESGIGEIILVISEKTEIYFSKKDYGQDTPSLGIFFICQNPKLNLKQRVRYSKKRNILYLDVMLDFKTIISLKPTKRRAIVFNELLKTVSEVTSRYKWSHFKVDKFIFDLKKCLDRFET